MVLSTVNLHGCTNPIYEQMESNNMSETETTIEFEPITECEHYIAIGKNIYGVNRDTKLENWTDQKVSFQAKINGESAFFTPSEFFVSSGKVYFSCNIGENEYHLKQYDNKIEEISELPDEPDINRTEFSGTVGDFEVEYKDKPYQTYKHVKNSRGHFLNHQSSDFAFPVSDKILLYVNDMKMLYVVYTMPNGRPAKNSLLCIQSESLNIY